MVHNTIIDSASTPIPPSDWILYDTEYTTWEGARERHWSGPGECREIVQIGAIRIQSFVEPEHSVKSERFVEVAHFDRLVLPVKNPQLSEYFSNLTGITQSQVEATGDTFPLVLQEFFEWSEGLPLYAFGRDAEVLTENCALNNLPCPFPATQLHDLREVFKALGLDTQPYFSSTILEAFGEKSLGQAHNALADVRNVLSAYIWLLLVHNDDPDFRANSVTTRKKS